MTQHFIEGMKPIRPIQFLTVGEKERIPAPLIRITTCGLLTIEIAEEIVGIDPPQVRYTSLTPEQLRGRGTGPALMLLKLLLNRHERFASREWLMEQFCRDGELFSTVRLDNIVSMLRGLLCPPEYQDLRKHIIAHVRGSTSSGDGYQLAAHPLIWADQDALAWNVEQATRMERFGDDSLLFWERAYEIAQRGPYLPDELYADWSRRQRGEVDGALRQSVQALVRLYQFQHGASGEEESLRLLRSHWLEHPHEEDVLRPLMELLGKRGCTHEALGYYEQLCRFLKEDEREPDAQTQDVAAYLRTKQVQRRPTQLFPIQKPPTLPSAMEQVVPPHTHVVPFEQYSNELETNDMDPVRRRLAIQGVEVALGLVSFPYLSADALGERLLMALTRHHSPDMGTVHYLHQRVEHYWNQRQTAKLGATLIPYVTEDLHQVMVLLEGSCLADTRTELLLIVGNLSMLLGELLYEYNLYPSARKYYKTAAIAAHEANALSLEAVVYGRKSLTWIYQDHLQPALSCVQHGKQLARGDKRVTTWLAAVEAEIEARMGNEPACLASLRETSWLYNAGNQKAFHWIYFDASLLAGYEGACFLKLKKSAEAHQSLTKAITVLDTKTLRRKPRLLIDLAESYVQQQEIEAACETLLAALSLLNTISSPVTEKRLLTVRSQLHPWQELDAVQRIDESLDQLKEKQRMHQL